MVFVRQKVLYLSNELQGPFLYHLSQSVQIIIIGVFHKDSLGYGPYGFFDWGEGTYEPTLFPEELCICSLYPLIDPYQPD